MPSNKQIIMPNHSANLIIEGYASLFNIPDQSGDIIAPMAFRQSLKNRPARSIRFLYQHTITEPIGIWLDIVEDSYGLYVYGRLQPEVRRAVEVAALTQSGAIDGLSIGFKTTKATRLNNGERHIYQIDLWEISIVTFPVQSGARIRHF